MFGTKKDGDGELYVDPCGCLVAVAGVLLYDAVRVIMKRRRMQHVFLFQDSHTPCTQAAIGQHTTSAAAAHGSTTGCLLGQPCRGTAEC